MKQLNDNQRPLVELTLTNEKGIQKQYRDGYEDYFQYQSNASRVTAVLLVNLGSPAAPNRLGIKKFLIQFLSDPRVVKLPRLLWWFILRFLVVPLRAKRVAGLYQKIWTKEGSPLIVNTHKLGKKLAEKLTELDSSVQLFVAMTYGKPSLKEAFLKLRQCNINELIVLPLYPQYSSTTTGAVFDAISNELATGIIPTLHFIPHYCYEALYLKSLANVICQFYQTNGLSMGQDSRFIFSFHGIPEREVIEGDPYEAMCYDTAEGVAKLVNFPVNYCKIAFQSRFGFTPWVKPSLEQQLLNCIQEGVFTVVVIAPSFAVDCLETLEEIEIRTRKFFLSAGGKQFYYIPALNDNSLQVNAFISLIEKYFKKIVKVVCINITFVLC